MQKNFEDLVDKSKSRTHFKFDKDKLLKKVEENPRITVKELDIELKLTYNF